MNQLDVQGLRSIVQEAGSLLLSYFQRPLEIRLKGGKSPVSSADIAVNEFLIRRLQQLEPSAVIISEESPTIQHDASSAWVIDPLDGTTNFIHGLPLFAVAVAYRQRGVTLASIIYAPALNMLFWADGTKAYLNDQPLPLTTVSTAPAIAFVSPKLFKRFPSLPTMLPENYVCRSLGSVALEFAYTAMGHGSYLYTYPLSAWDLYPGLHILELSGGLKIQLENKFKQICCFSRLCG